MSLLTKFLRYGSIALALCGFVAIMGISRLQAQRQTAPPSEPPVPPPQKPFTQAVAATGIIEALSENVAIGVPQPGIVTEVAVKVNDQVKKGQVLFKLDDRDLRAQELTAKAKQNIARAQLAVSEAQLGKFQAQLARLTGVANPRVVSRDDLENRQQDVAVATAQLEAAKAMLAAADSDLASVALLIERLTVRAPRDGSVLQINVRAGEYAATAPKLPAMFIGDLQSLQIRADVDEQNATRIRPGQPAKAYLKGDPTIAFDLEFVRVEPYVIPKLSLTGAGTERIDTRVLQVIYTLKRPADTPLYVGQQVNVFIAAPERTPAP